MLVKKIILFRIFQPPPVVWLWILKSVHQSWPIRLRQQVSNYFQFLLPFNVLFFMNSTSIKNIKKGPQTFVSMFLPEFFPTIGKIVLTFNDRVGIHEHLSDITDQKWYLIGMWLVQVDDNIYLLKKLSFLLYRNIFFAYFDFFNFFQW